jgi:hypothetical protein
LQFISIFCPVVNGLLPVFCPVGVRLLSASEFGSAPGIELNYVMKKGATNTFSKNYIIMNTTHQSPAQVRSIYKVPADCDSITELLTKTGGMDNSFLIVDSTEMELFPLMSLAGTDDAAVLYIEKGEVTLVHDLETYKLSKGMLLYKVPKVTVQLLSFSEDCHFKVFCFAPQFAIAGGMPIKHVDTITVIASNNPVLKLDTLTAATLTVLFWLLQKKASWGEKAESHDETTQHVFSLLMLEIASSFKRMIADDPTHEHEKN